MTLTELRYIVAVARHRHFGRAAESCHVSQPTLSMGVRRLEEQLGVVLFERGHGEVRITPVGEALVAQAQRVLDEAERIPRIAGQYGDPLDGPLKLGAIYTIGPYLLPWLIPVLHERAPRMPLLIEEDYTAGLARRLRSGELDAILVALPFDEPGIDTRPLYEEPFVALLPAAHPLNEAEELTLETLAGDDLLLLGPGHCFRDQLL
ncbi:MAG: LysR family transcriptional regulator, partial [Gammaproteobacteria bacterium]